VEEDLKLKLAFIHSLLDFSSLEILDPCPPFYEHTTYKMRSPATREENEGGEL
jgi:hypothetical protein